MSIEKIILIRSVLLWDDCFNRMELLAFKILLLERRLQDIEIAVKKFKEVREKNKIVFDHKHRLRPQAIKNRDWMWIYDSSWDGLHSTTRKLAKNSLELTLLNM